MIIDVHYHLFPFPFPPEVLKHELLEPLRVSKIMGIKWNEEEMIKKATETMSDLDGQKIIKRMNEAGIDHTLVCHVDNIDMEVLTPEVTQLINKMIADIANKYPNRLTSLAGIDPRRSEAVDMIKQCFEEFGMKGLKYHADNGFDPSGPESYKILEYLDKKNGILLTHSGPLGGTRSKFTEPNLLADILVDFPNIKLIAAHMGSFVNWRPWAAIAAFSNLYGDLAMWQAYAFGKFEMFCRELRDLIDCAGIEKILFGTDGPVYEIVAPVKQFIEKLKSLPTSSPSGIQFTKEEIDAILGGNAATLLGIENR